MAKKSQILESFDRVLKECQCAGAAAGPGNISSFAPENVLGVKDIHTKDKEELSESEVKSENPNNYYYASEEKDIEYPKVNPNNMKVNKSLSEAEVKSENPNNYYYSDAEDDIEYSQINPNNMKVNKKLPENQKCMPRTFLNESRALPGGNLHSEEHTAYEDWLRDRHLKQDKVKAKEYGKNKLGLYDDDCGENGWHNWDGTKIERKVKNY